MSRASCLPLQVSPADFILRERPVAVVMETAVTPDHGSATGNVFMPDPPGARNPYDVAEIACRASDALQQEADPQNGNLWKVRHSVAGVTSLCRGARLASCLRQEPFSNKPVLGGSSLQSVLAAASHLLATPRGLAGRSGKLGAFQLRA